MKTIEVNTNQIVKVVLLLFFVQLSAQLSAQFSSRWTVGPNFVIEGFDESVYLGTKFIPSIYYEFNRNESSGLSSIVGIRVGYSDFKKEARVFPTNLLGLEILISDEDYNQFGIFIDYMWSYKEFNAGLQVYSTLYEDFILNDLDLIVGLQVGYDRRHKNFDISPGIGIKLEL